MIKSTDLKKLEDLFRETGNQLVVLYGSKNCKKEQLIKHFLKDKKFFYYRCRQAETETQKKIMGQEISECYGVRLSKYTYDEYFDRVKSGDPSKLVVVIDEFQYIAKKDEEFMKSILKLKGKRLYPGPVMIILASSSITWSEFELPSRMGDNVKKITEFMKLEDLKFIDVVRMLPENSATECVKMYGVIGGVEDYLRLWDKEMSFKENVCKLILARDGLLFHEAENVIASELRELSVYSTILSAIASGNTKLNDLYHVTGFSRAKISVYLKNLAHFDIIEKVVSFDTGGWDNVQKGVYQIKNTLVNFWFKFVYPHLSDLYLMKPQEFYEEFIEDELDEYLNRYFCMVCREYLYLMNKLGKLPFDIVKIGTWVGKEGSIDIVAQSTARESIVSVCNWKKGELTAEMCDKMFDAMEKAHISSKHFYLFSATSFDRYVIERAKEDSRYVLIDMNEF